MSRRSLAILGALAALMIGTSSALAAGAAATPSPGCKGVANALAQADFSKGKAALTAVADKLGCTTTQPPPADPMACTVGTERSTWTYTPEGASYAWQFTAFYPWTLTSGSVLTRPTYAEAAGGGYWESDVAVSGWMLQSTTGQIVWVANPSDARGGLFNQNSFDPDVLGGRTGIMLVRFCG